MVKQADKIDLRAGLFAHCSAFIGTPEALGFVQ